MPQEPIWLTAGQASRELGISAKALRLYERQGLLVPDRTRNGWRSYGPAHLERGREIKSLRKLGLGLAEIAALLKTDSTLLGNVLARHHARLESQMRELQATLRNVREACRDLADDRESVGMLSTAASFALPWPWDGEWFSLPDLPPLTYLTGPLGSGKTKLAMRLAEVLPDGEYLSLERLDVAGRPYSQRIEVDAGLRASCAGALSALERNGAMIGPALTVLMAALLSHRSAPLVVDMVEQGLDHATQLALSFYLRHRARPARPLVLMTRSSAIFDITTAESGETIIYCPANHGTPLIVGSDPSCRGYEAVLTCLATPEARARTEGVIASWAKTPHLPRDDSRETIC